jgi:hypothetical protein
LFTQGNISAKSIPKVVDKQGLGHRKNNKANGRVTVKGHEIPLWNKGGYLNTIRAPLAAQAELPGVGQPEAKLP